jgi:U3 small nucleolar RNA-associated protein 14
MSQQTRREFTPEYLRELMPKTRRKSAVQVLKRFKNRVMQMCEEAAKQDREKVAFRLQRLEMGATLVENLEEYAEELCEWLQRKGFWAEVDAGDALVVHITWADQPEKEEEEEEPVRKPVVNRAAVQGPWFDWMSSAQDATSQGKTPVKKR